MRRHMLLVFPALVLAACSSSGSSQGTAGSKSSPSPSAVPLTAAQAKIAAAAGVLTRADLPGYSSQVQKQDATDVATERSGRACLGLPTANYSARNFGV